MVFLTFYKFNSQFCHKEFMICATVSSWSCICWLYKTSPSSTVKKTECQRIDAFELWCWRRLLRVPWIARRSNQSILGVHWKDWCWRWNSNTLATSCRELTYWKRPWGWEGLGAGGEGDNRGWDGWMASPPRWTWVWVNLAGVGDGQGGLGCCNSWGRKELDMTEWLNWTELKVQ